MIEQNGTEELKAALQRANVSYLEAAAIAALSPDEQRQHKKVATAIRALEQERLHPDRLRKRREYAGTVLPLPSAKFDVILADPPWTYTKGRNIVHRISPDLHYPTLEAGDLAGLDVESLAKPDALLFMWATAYVLPQALALIEAWGFHYLTSAVWVKTREDVTPDGPVRLSHVAGQGPLLMTHELLLIGKRGDGLGRPRQAQPRSVFFAPGGGGAAKRAPHSTKPPVAHEMIERQYPGTDRLELFARAPRDGWSTWGYDATPADAGDLVEHAATP